MVSSLLATHTKTRFEIVIWFDAHPAIDFHIAKASMPDEKGVEVRFIYAWTAFASISISCGVLQLRKCHSFLTPFSYTFKAKTGGQDLAQKNHRPRFWEGRAFEFAEQPRVEAVRPPVPVSD